MDKHIARIVPPEANSNGVTLTQGTKVFVGGVQMTGVTHIELSAGISDVWTARITCHAQPPVDLSTTAFIKWPTRWQRLKAWLIRG